MPRAHCVFEPAAPYLKTLAISCQPTLLFDTIALVQAPVSAMTLPLVTIPAEIVALNHRFMRLASWSSSPENHKPPESRRLLIGSKAPICLQIGSAPTTVLMVLSDVVRSGICDLDAKCIGNCRDRQIHYPCDCRDAVTGLARQSDRFADPIAQATDAANSFFSHLSRRGAISGPALGPSPSSTRDRFSA